MSVAVIIPAAGRSSRFGAGEKKPFVALGGRAVWRRSADLFLPRADVSVVFVVISPDDRAEFEERFAAQLTSPKLRVIDGGAERFESVTKALAEVPEGVHLVAVHDAVRPLCPPRLIDAVFAAAETHGAAMLAVPLADTLKRVDAANRIIETVTRAGLWQAQTPQVFRRDWLVEAYDRRGELTAAITDDAQLVEAAGHAVAVVPGSPLNFKITTRDDLLLAEAALEMNHESHESDE